MCNIKGDLNKMTSVVRLQKIGDMYAVVDNTGKVIIGNIHDADELYREDDMIIRFMTKDNEYSYIDSNGLYFGKYSYKEYDVVCELLPMFPIYKVKRNGKYGIINTNYSEKELLNCEFDEINFLQCNIFEDTDIVKVKKDDKYSLLHGFDRYDDYKEYEYIFTPIQPLSQFIVCHKGRYGFIDAGTFEEIVEPKFSSIEDLCNEYGCNIDKYTKDLYSTKEKLQLGRVVDSEHCMSYIVDVNNIVKGRWGGNGELVYDRRKKEVYVHYLYYSPLNKRLPINMYGGFYNLFDCRKYDVVVHVIGKLYLIIKNNKYGLIDSEFNVLLDVSYENIAMARFTQMETIPLFVVTCEKGQFLYNAETKKRSRIYDSLSWHGDVFISGNYRNYLVYEEQGKFGLLSPDGQVLVKAKYDLYQIDFIERGRIKRGHAYFQEIFHNRKYGFYIEDNKFYGKIPIDKYDTCICIGELINKYYITKLGGKYGLLNSKGEEIEIPKFDDMIFSREFINSGFAYSYYSKNKKTPISETFLIGRIRDKYYLYSIKSIVDSKEAILIISDCDKMEMIETTNHIYIHKYPYVYFKKGEIEGYVNEDGLIISRDTFDEIKQINVKYGRCYYLIYKDGKVGLLNSDKKVMLPCIYDDIKNVTDSSAVVSDNGTEKDVEYSNMKILNNSDDSFFEDTSNYSKYAGSYAQDEMGYSDEDIDSIFDGDPDAYWNID